MGVSFINKDEICGTSAKREVNEFDSFYPPHLKAECLPMTQSISTASSMARNSAALKDLDDDVLGGMARRLQRSGETNTVSRYGLPESQFSMATKEFLAANGLIEGIFVHF